MLCPITAKPLSFAVNICCAKIPPESIHRNASLIDTNLLILYKRSLILRMLHKVTGARI